MNDPCKKWLPRLMAWFDDEASELDAKEVRARLLDCAPCRAAVQSWRELRLDLSLLQPDEPTEEVLERMAWRFEEGLADEIHSTSTALRWWGRLAAALMIGLGGLLIAERTVMPLAGTVEASTPREIEEAVQEILQRPVELMPLAPERPVPSGR